METVSPDRELVSRYAREGSEAAFHALVARHVHLVFATALRQVGDRGIAEEVTQNTFVALARKAPHLANHQTLAGWLHRTATLEAKLRIRTEIRRHRREVAAMELAQLKSDGSNPAETLSPMLDEGLLSLRESERLALLLRFFEGHSLSKVGTALGVSEEAARKRVDRALQRLSEFFRLRGFAIPAASGSAWLTQAAVTVPPSLASTCSIAGISAGAGGGGLAKLLLHTSLFTEARGMLMVGILASLPLGWQWQSLRGERAEHDQLIRTLTAERDQLADLTAQTSDLDSRLALARRRASLRPSPPQKEPSSFLPANGVAVWDDASTLLRIPKSLMASLEIFGVRNNRGQLSEVLIEALQLKPEEIAKLEAALSRFLDGCHAAEAKGLRREEPREEDLFGNTRENTRVFVLPDTQEDLERLRKILMAEFHETLDPIRTDLLRKSLSKWMPWDNEYHGLSSSFGVHQVARRIRFYRGREQPHQPDLAVLGMNISMPERGTINGTEYVEEIPEYLKPHLQDWIEEARRLNDAPVSNLQPKP